ncbi:hypothetical protein BGZ60DRAFT_421752 [Tricladium varicosporioides]|nr:hypothetical protein BGZ60DRAFT_421752 [Hymenoscyphus varicosporioides]
MGEPGNNPGTQSNNQLSIQTSPLCIRPSLEQFKFHVFLECDGCQETTLGNDPLQFIIKTQEIVRKNGERFQHRLTNNIWNMVLQYKKIGDGSKIIIPVPFNEGKFDWKTKNSTMRNADLWVRVFEVGSESAAGTIAGINEAGPEFLHCQEIFNAAHSSAVLKSYSVSWKETIARIDTEMANARGKYAEAHIIWIKGLENDEHLSNVRARENYLAQ